MSCELVSTFCAELMKKDEDHYRDEDAVRDLCLAGMNAELRPYGFEVTHSDSAGQYEGECGGEHDLSVSFSLIVNGPPAKWFFRYSVHEMTQFLISSFQAYRQGQFDTFVQSLADVDDKYDYRGLEKRLAEEQEKMLAELRTRS
jgi:hypothetical protein